MLDANIEIAQPRRRLFRYLKATPLHLLMFTTHLVNRFFVFQLTERILEYPFIHEKVSFNGKGKILDVGSGRSLLPFELASKGYQTWSIDLKTRYHRYISNYNNLTLVGGDIRKTSFSDSFFDIVTAISSIEHIGLSGGKIQPDGDQDAVQEIFRILKPGGRFLMTVPFGKGGVYTCGRHDLFRIYNYAHLKSLLNRFEIEESQFAVLESGTYRPSSLEEAEAVDSLSQPRWYSSKAVAMFVTRKPFTMGGD